MHETYAEALPKARGPNGRRALDYSYVMKDLVDASKAPDLTDAHFTDTHWAPLAKLVATDRFERIGNFLERVNWTQYATLLTMWGKSTDWTYRVRRVTEGEDYAVLELAETAVYTGRVEEYNSVSVYEFGADGLLEHLDVYLQMPAPPAPEQRPSWDLAALDAGPA